MNLTEFLEKFVCDKLIESNRYSSFSIALEDARKITGRDVATGELKHHILTNKNNGHLEPYSFIGITNYLLLLEIIGKVFEPNVSSSGKKGICGALQHFSDIDEKDQYVIEALRNALVHSYSLVNIPSNQDHNENSQHLFTLSAFEDAPLIRYPDISWDGNFNNKAENRSTIVQTNRLFDEIELIVENVRAGVRDGSIKSRIKLPELKARYTIRR
jgi:hypothetical protein